MPNESYRGRLQNGQQPSPCPAASFLIRIADSLFAGMLLLCLIGTVHAQDAADPYSPRLGLSRGETYFYATIGNERTVVRGFSVAALAALRLTWTDVFGKKRDFGEVEVISADYGYVFSYMFAAERRPVRLKIGLGHFSAHLSDDGLKRGFVQDRNGLTQDFVRTIVYYDSPKVRLYGGPWLRCRILPDRLDLVQLGMEIRPVDHLYGACDIQFKSTINWGTSQVYQVGWVYRHVRIFGEYRAGFCTEGSFFQTGERSRFRLGLNIH